MDAIFDPRPARLATHRPHAAIRWWLATIAALVYATILVGGLTRLTDSGLSITEWAPLSGVVPPLTEEQWNEAFAAYRLTEEFRVDNSGMDLAEFRYIYWWEWGHRQLGRTVGIAFALPLLVFLRLGWLTSSLRRRLVLILALGALQGGIGWWMVSSGIGTTRTDVAPSRLMIHFGLALTILGLCFWTILSLDPPPRHRLPARAPGLATALAAIVFVQMLCGALTAGLDGGLIYNEWPTMGGRLLAADILAMEPAWKNLVENPAGAQAAHRLLAYAVLAVAALAALRARTAGFIACLMLAMAQAVLGILTLLRAAPLPLALAHQALGVVLFLATLVELRRQCPPRPAADGPGA